MLNLSKQSIFLINYYYNLVKRYNKKILFSDNYKKNSFYNNFQKYIFDSLINIYNVLDNDIYYISNLREVYKYNSNIYKNLINNIYNKHFINNYYIDEKIKNYIKNTLAYLIIYKVPFNNKTIIINVITYSKISIKLLEKYDKLVKNMIVQIYLINDLIKNNNCSEESLNIYLFLTPFKRELTKNQEKILGSLNVNGGFCYGCISNGEIVVYREEELFKVFTHELLHNFGLDLYIWDFMYKVKINNSKENKIYYNFLNNFNLPRENNLGIQECLIEFWAEFFNNVIYSFIYSKNYNTLTFNEQFKLYKDTFDSIMELEILHSFMQTTKILYYNNLSYSDLFIKNRLFSYKEDTHIFSYYILKLFLLFDYKEFINSKISVKKNYSLIFSHSLYNMQKFLNYLILIAKNNKVIINFKFIRELYINIKLIENKNVNIKFLLNNLRISLLEYN